MSTAELAADVKAVAFTCLTVLLAEIYTLSLASMSAQAVKERLIETSQVIPDVIAVCRASVVSFVA